MKIGIVGAGLLGRLLAWRLALEGYQITLFDKSSQLGEESAAYAAGGMLALLAEQEIAEPVIYDLAKESLLLWKKWLTQLNCLAYFHQKGSLFVSHEQDRLELAHVIKRINRHHKFDSIRELDRQSLQKLEPELNFSRAYFSENEAQIDSRRLLNALNEEIFKNKQCCYIRKKVEKISQGFVETDENTFRFDWVFDCRGIGAQLDFTDLRPVRGELIYLYAPEVKLKRVIRFFHPRYRFYLIPRPKNIYLLGATEIEVFDSSPISLRSCLELLSAAYSLHKGFAEARITETVTAIRPAFSDNLPKVHYRPNWIAINGLYRHGFLIAPALVNDVVNILKCGVKQSNYSHLICQEPIHAS